MRKNYLSAVVAGLVANDAITDVNPESVASSLVKVETEAYKADYTDITFTDILPVINLNDSTATSFAYYYVTEAGKAHLSNNDGKIAWVDSYLGMKQVDLHDGNVGYKYSIKELQRISKLGGRLDSLKVETAVSASLELAQEIAYFGDESRGIVGFYNNPDVPSVAPIGGTDWTGKTAIQIVADINHLFGTAFKTTKQKEFKQNNKTNRLLLPTDKWTQVATTKISENSNTTILEFIAQKCPFISDAKNIISSVELADNTMRIYQKDKRKVAFYWGHTINFKAPQSVDLMIQVPADFSIGGTVNRKPLSCWDMEGI